MTRDDPFVRRLVSFGRLLREGGLEVGAGRLQDAVHALTAVDVASRDDVYWALRCCLCSKHEHIEVFDALFDAFWRHRLDEAAMAAVQPDGDP